MQNVGILEIVLSFCKFVSILIAQLLSQITVCHRNNSAIGDSWNEK